MSLIRRRFLALFAGLSASVVACSTKPATSQSPATIPSGGASPNPPTAPSAPEVPTSTPIAAATVASTAHASTTPAVAATARSTPATRSVSTPGTTPVAASSQSAPAPSVAQASSGSVIVLEPKADGTQARFTVREQLADRTLPSYAIGTTKAVTGKITVRPDGSFVPDQSQISVDLTTLKTDRPQRDNFIKRNTL